MVTNGGTGQPTLDLIDLDNLLEKLCSLKVKTHISVIQKWLWWNISDAICVFVNVSLIVRLRTQGFLFLNTGKGIKVETGSKEEGLLTTNSSAYFVRGAWNIWQELAARNV